MLAKQSLSAIVTGGASGIDEAVSKKLASRGINVLIADLQADRGTALAQQLSSSHGVQAEYLKTDISREDDIIRMVQTAAGRWGRLDLAANCAGICEAIWAEEESITAELVDRLRSSAC